MQTKKKTKISDAKPITMSDLGTFPEEVIFPGVERIVREVRQELRGEIQGVRQELRGEIQGVRQELMTKMDDVLNEVRNENLKNLQSNDIIITKLDTILKDQAAHASLHTRITDDLMSHDKRITKLEETKTS